MAPAAARSGDDELAFGLYEQLVTAKLRRRLDQLPVGVVPHFGETSETELPALLGRHVGDLVTRLTESNKVEGLELANSIIRLLEDSDELLSPNPLKPKQPQQLRALSQQIVPGVYQLFDPTVRPKTPLTEAALLTNSVNEPSLMAELKLELASVDRVDLLCAFIRWTGLRLLLDELRLLRNRGVPVRVITTTYIGATERKAVDELVRLGAEVQIAYETHHTRLHAKAWLLRRATGFDTAYVGSSNLSEAALLDGVEWNVRLSSTANRSVLKKFEAVFDSYWNSSKYEPYDPETDAERLDRALLKAKVGSARGQATNSLGPLLDLSGLDVHPYPHQAEMLEALTAERETHNIHHNLIVAATGTGKTVIAALDYKNLRSSHEKDLTLLFVAHRKEILTQALRTYREVLVDGTFGELYVDGDVPHQGKHVFASIQSLVSTGSKINPRTFDVVVVDEFHHATAASYRNLLDQIDPIELLGMTATPERTDGTDVRDLFNGRIAAELRLWDALEAELLCPFHYFGIADNTDLKQVTWRRGGYDTAELERIFTSDDGRVALILQELEKLVPDLATMRTIGFCVSVAHAEYMAKKFTAAGVVSQAVSGGTDSAERLEALTALKRGSIQVLFAVDLFNEGVDIPQVDTLLLLRPTESPTLFLQQLGRGLRRDPGKAVCTVVDFVGQHRKEFRYDLRLLQLAKRTRSDLINDIETGFPFLPSGCAIHLDKIATERILANVKSVIDLKVGGWRTELKQCAEALGGDVGLARFLKEQRRDATDFYRRDPKRTWTSLRRAAGLPSRTAGPHEDALLASVSALLHVDNPERTGAYRRLLEDDIVRYADLDARMQSYARMLIFALWPTGKFNELPIGSYDEALTLLAQHPAVRDEIIEIIEMGADNSRHAAQALDIDIDVPLHSHARYSRDEIMPVLGTGLGTGKAPGYEVQGVLRYPSARAIALLITLNKSERDFSPTTRYRDYALGPDLFHWESQSGTAESSTDGRSYIRHEQDGTRIVLFVREQKKDAYTCLGTASYLSHVGEKPMAVTWKLHRAMPPDLEQAARIALD